MRSGYFSSQLERGELKSVQLNTKDNTVVVTQKDGKTDETGYTDGGADQTLTIDISGAWGKHLKLDLKGVPKNRTNDHTLSVGSNQLKVLKFELTGGSASRACEFNGPAKFTVRQLN
mgnify:CR=1 FL=1